MGTLADAIRAAKEAVQPFAAAQVDSGERTAVNGHELHALWEDAQPDRAAAYLTDDEWARGAYIVSLPRKALFSPWLVKNGSEIMRVSSGAKGTVKKIDPPVGRKVFVLVVMTAGV